VHGEMGERSTEEHDLGRAEIARAAPRSSVLIRIEKKTSVMQEL